MRPTGLVARPPISCSWPVHGHRWLTRHLIPFPFHTRLHLQNMPTYMSSDRGAVASSSCATARRYRYALATWPIGTLVATGICDFKSATARAGRASGARSARPARAPVRWSLACKSSTDHDQGGAATCKCRWRGGTRWLNGFFKRRLLLSHAGVEDPRAAHPARFHNEPADKTKRQSAHRHEDEHVDRARAPGRCEALWRRQGQWCFESRGMWFRGV